MIQRDRQSFDSHATHDILRDTVADRIVDRIRDIKRKFPIAVDLGAGNGNIKRKLLQHWDEQVGGIQTLIQVEMSKKLLERDGKDPSGMLKIINYVEDEELFSMEPESVDLVISNLALHWINDLPGLFKRVHRMLKPDGVFLASVWGGDTLQEMRSAFALADMERLGGVSPHVSPFMHIGDVGNLLTSHGFSMPTVDSEHFVVQFPDALTVMEYLRHMGESTADINRSKHVPRDVIIAAASAYHSLYKEDNFVPCTFQSIFFIGWKPHESQPKPMKRGTANSHFGDLEKLVPLK